MKKTIIQIREENGNVINNLIEYIDDKVINWLIYNYENRINSNELNGDNIYKNKIKEIKNYGIELQKIIKVINKKINIFY